ncbi:MAG: heat-inducible transcription repressor HrcA [Bryobacterales bacterium]|nr:heat-inducible transcription repressor HrcA [Bryobacterales bacterium]
MKQGSEQLSTRSLEILQAIVREYISTGEPVASRAVSRARRDNLSAATIRNEMADLVDAGYLEQPHTSAGRVPTAKAFRRYVQSLVPRNFPVAELDRLRSQLSSSSSAAERTEQTCHILTGLTRNVGIAAAIPSFSATLDCIELVSLGENRVLIVVVTEDQAVHNKVVNLGEAISQDELNSIRNYVNHHLSGLSLLHARAELERRLADDSAIYDRLLTRLSLFHRMGLLAIDLDPEVFTEGASHLVALELHVTREKLRHLLETLEEKSRLLRLLDLFLATNQEGIAVQVGLHEIHPGLGDFSLIGTNVRLPDGSLTRLAVLGPLRMNYERVIATVRHVSQAVVSERDVVI